MNYKKRNARRSRTTQKFDPHFSSVPYRMAGDQGGGGGNRFNRAGFPVPSSERHFRVIVRDPALLGKHVRTVSWETARSTHGRGF